MKDSKIEEDISLVNNKANNDINGSGSEVHNKEAIVKKEFPQFNSHNDIYQRKSLIPQEPNISLVIKHDNGYTNSVSSNNELENKSEDEVPKKYNIEIKKKVFFVKTYTGKCFIINGDEANDTKENVEPNNNIEQQKDKNDIEYGVSNAQRKHNNNNYSKKAKDKHKSYKTNLHKMKYKNYNDFDSNPTK